MSKISRRTFIAAAGSLFTVGRSVVAADARSDAEARSVVAAYAPSDAELRKAFLTAIVDKQREELEKIESDQAALRKRGLGALFVMPPRVIPFLDWDYFYIDRELKWFPNEGIELLSVKVPRGFVTDLASIPRAFWSIIPKTGRYAYPAIVHDYLYWEQRTTRSIADDVFREAMKELDVSPVAREGMWATLRLAGGSAWEANATAKASGEKRILKKFPPDSLMPWSKWQQTTGVF